METIINTDTVVVNVSFLLNQEIFLASIITSLIYFLKLCIITNKFNLAGVRGIEPPTPGFGDRCSTN